MNKGFHTFCFLWMAIVSQSLHAQTINTNGGILFKTQLVFGNQNQQINLGLYAFGVLNYKQVSSEHGVSLASYTAFKRHNVKTSGFGYKYEIFSLLGYGQSLNLLGSTVSNQNSAFVFNTRNNSSFKGIGFGFEKEFLPKELKQYELRRGKLIVRISEGDYSVHFNFLNDFQIGKLFYGEATDFGETGSLYVGFSKMMSGEELYQIGTGFTIFTPEPNYLKSPRNPINSDDGRKNVWFVKPNNSQHFYGNWFGMATYQSKGQSFRLSTGVNSQKIGAAIQNWLHDGFGLNPRYPWDVTQKGKLYYEWKLNGFVR